MHVLTRRPHELTDNELTAWQNLLAGNHQFDSPFFHPHYVRQLGEFRDRVEVAVLADGSQPVGFLPFERHARGVGRPPGIKLCDFQGVVAAAETPWTTAELVTGAGLSVLHFDHLLSSPSPLAACSLREDLSPFLDLSAGYDEYLAERKRAKSGLISQTLRKRRKLEREVGAVEFSWHDSADEPWDRLLEWKSAQRARTGTVNILDWSWARDFLNSLRQQQTGPLRGAVSTLRANGQLLAVHFGIHTEHVLHYWFPTYDRQFSRYSPGLIILLELAQHCGLQHIRRIDLGKGDEDYKYSFASGTRTVLTGAADIRPLRHALRSASHCMREWLRNSPLRGPAQLPKRVFRRLQSRLALG